jgi:Tol biopolymer transport system component
VACLGLWRPVESAAATITNPVSITVGTLPDDAALIFWSTRAQFAALGPSDLYVANSSGGNVTRMTFSAKLYEHAALSFDRRYIVANRYPSGSTSQSSVWIIDLKNRTEARLLPEHYHSGGGGVDWSPDGFVYFASQVVSGGPSNVFKMKPDGTQVTQLTFNVQDFQSTPPDPAGLNDVSVSDDGTQVAYVRVFASLWPNGAYGPKPQVWIMNSDGTNQRMLYDHPSQGGISGNDPIGAWDPEFSPDGTKVTFTRTNLDYVNFPQYNIATAHDVMIINTDGTGLTQVTSVGPVSLIPDWQNGKILYTEYWDAAAIGSGTNYTGPAMINPDGTGKVRLESGLSLWRGGRHVKFIRPTTNATTCSGDWSSCSQAFTNDTARATATTSGTTSRISNWRNYGFALPATSTIHSVSVLANFYSSNTTGQIEVRVSGDGGASYGPAHVVGGNTSEQTFLIDVTGDLAWTSSALSNTNFRVQVRFFKSSGTNGNITGNLRWVPVKVSYTP